MKKEYNKITTSDIPMDASFSPSLETEKPKKTTTAKPKINAIGKSTTNKAKKPSTTTKTGQSKAGQTKTTQTKTSKTTQTKTSKTTSTEDKSVDKKLRTKLTSSDSNLTDLEKLNEENIKSYRFKSKRNKVVIVILSMLLAITIIAMTIYFVIARLETNCNMYVHGVNAKYFVDGKELSEFRTPANLQGNRVLMLDIELEIEDLGFYNIKFKPECFQKGVLMENTLVYEHNNKLFYDGMDGYYYSINPISGGQKIQLCGGIILDFYYEGSLNVDNFRLDFHTYCEKIK